MPSLRLESMTTIAMCTVRKEKGRVEFEKELPRRSYIYRSALRYKLKFSGGRDPLCARRECIAARTSIVKSLDLMDGGASM